MDFLDEIQSRVLPADAEMQRRLEELGVPSHACREELCVNAGETVAAVHDEFIAAGARVIRTNTFAANAVQLATRGLSHRVSEINWSAAQLARDCARGKGVYVAGRVGPLQMTAEQARADGIDRAEVFEEQIGALLDGGAQLICFESFTDVEEMLIALTAKQALHHCPAICSFAPSQAGLLAGGTEISAAFSRLIAADADLVGVGSGPGPAAMARLLTSLPTGVLLAGFPNARETEEDSSDASVEHFAAGAKELVLRRVRLLGGGRGTGPQHVAAVAALLNASSEEGAE